MNITIQLEGFDELKQKLDAVESPAVRKRIGLQGLLAGGFIVEMHAKLNADRHGLRKTGNLINSISTAAHIFEANPVVTVGTRGIVYAAIHEFGGIIRPKRAKMLSWIDERTGERRFAKQVSIPARPYLRPAVDEHKGEIADAIGDNLARLIEEAFK